MSELTKFLDTHGRALFRLLLHVTLREDVSEDLMQELFLKLSASEGFRSATRPLAYARRAALNLAFDWRRNQVRFPSATTTAEDGRTDDRPSPLEYLVEREQIQQILDAMAGLSKRHRELLTMHYIQQESYEALATEYGKTPHQIRALCHKALGCLREILADGSHETDRGESA